MCCLFNILRTRYPYIVIFFYIHGLLMLCCGKTSILRCPNNAKHMKIMCIAIPIGSVGGVSELALI